MAQRLRADRASASPRAGFTLRLSEAELRSRRARRARWRAPPLLACVGTGRAGAPWGFGKSAAEIISGIAAAPVVGVDDRARAAAPEARVPVDPSTATAESSREKPRRTQPTYNGLRLLPLWEVKPGSEPRQYCLDRGIVRLLLPEEQDAIEHREGTAGSVTDHRSRGTLDRRHRHHGKVNPAAVQFRRMERAAVRMRDSLFPARESVTEDYWEYAKFRFLQRMASSCITVFATQQMLAAIGMGASRRLPAAAAINWVLKDGLGRLGKLGVAANFGREFDSDVKRFRFTSSVVYDASSLIEMITPFFPKKFLVLATLANIGKSVGITTANVVRAPIQRSFVLEENLAEVAAKTSAQQVVADNLGLAVAVLATGLTGKVVNDRARLIIPFVAFIPLATMDLYCIYRELKAVQLTTINKERAEIICDHWINHGSVPGTKYVSDGERLFIPARMDESTLPLRVAGLHEACPTPNALANALVGGAERSIEREGEGDGSIEGSELRGRPYVLTYVPGKSVANPALRFAEVVGERCGVVARGKKARGVKGTAYLSLRQGATSRDVLRGMLQVAHLRHLPFRADLDADAARRWALEESAARAVADVDAFMAELTRAGWQHQKVLLSSAERAPFRVEGGAEGWEDLAEALSPSGGDGDGKWGGED